VRVELGIIITMISISTGISIIVHLQRASSVQRDDVEAEVIAVETIRLEKGAFEFRDAEGSYMGGILIYYYYYEPAACRFGTARRHRSRIAFSRRSS